jgi:DNA-binding CsgD family transcriptional regulator
MIDRLNKYQYTCGPLILMNPTDTALPLVGKIYDAAEDPDLWRYFLGDVAAVLQSNLATIVVHDLASLGGQVAVIEGGSEQAQQAYEGYWGANNIYVERGVGRLPPGTIIHGGMLCTDAEVLKTDYYHEFLKPNDWFYAAGGPIERDREIVSLFSIQRPFRKGQFTEDEIALLKLLMPHLQRAVRMHHHLHTLRSTVEAADSLLIGVIAVTASGKMLFANAYAHKIISQDDGLIIDRGGVIAARFPHEGELAALITSAAKTADGVGLHAGGGLAITRPSGKRSYIVSVVPTHSTVLTFTSQKPAAILFVTDPTEHVRPSQAVLRGLYGLTPAECRVALLMGDGRSPQEIARMLGVSSNTLKSQLASIYRKTDTSRQSQLVRLLMRLPRQPLA